VSLNGARSRSLRWRLPAFACGLSLLVLFVVLFLAYREVEATLEQAGGDRARHAAGEVAGIFARTTQQTVQQLQAVAPALRTFLRDPRDANRASAGTALAPLAPGANRHVTIWDASGARLLDRPEPAAAGAGPAVAPPAHVPLPGLSPLQMSGDQTFADLAATVHDGPDGGEAVLG